MMYTIGCQTDDTQFDQADRRADISPSEERMLDAILELNEVSKVILRDQRVKDEVFDLGRNEYYKDAYFGLQDLLNPTTSGVYGDTEVRNAGAFKQSFEAAFTPEEYPALAFYVARGAPELDDGVESRDAGDFADEANLYFYCPYCINYPEDVAEFTLVPSQTDADQAPGEKVASDGTVTEVTTDDSYAESNPTLIITPEFDDGPNGVGANSCPLPETTWCNDEGLLCRSACGQFLGCAPGGGCNTGGGGEDDDEAYEAWKACGGDDAIFTGNIQITNQYDKYISTTGNGGASEMVLGRVGNEAVIQRNGRYEFSGFEGSIQYDATRYMIRERKTRQWGREFDPGWRCEDGNQKFVLYEEDNTNEASIGGNLKFKPAVKILGAELNTEITVPLASVTIRSLDATIWTQTYERDEYINLNRENRDCGTSSWTGDRPIRRGAYAKYVCKDGFVTLPDVAR